MRRKKHAATGPDAIIMELAARNHGIVSRHQLLQKGVGAKVIDGRVARGQLRLLHRGVYQAGPIAGARAREIAAHFACGPDSVVSHRTAAVLWQLLRPLEAPQPVEMLVREGLRCHPDIIVRRSHTLCRDDITRLDGIPVTIPTRTIVDIAATVSARELEQAVAQSLALRLTTRTELERRLDGNHGRGTARLRALLAGEAALTRSEAEERLLALIRKAKLPQPSTNVQVAGFEVDFLWRHARLVVEVDGFAYHAGAAAFENDRRRDQALAATGLRVVRVTWKQLVHEPEAVLARLAAALAHA